MDLNREQLSEQEIQEKISEINRKIDEELLNSEQADMTLVNEYFRQIRELDGMPETSEEELKSELQLLYKKAGLQQKRKSPWMFRTVGRRVASVLIVIGLFSVVSASVYAARAPMVQFLSKTYDKYIEFFFGQSDVEKSPSTIETIYTLGLVPEGYELDSQSFEKESTVIVWQNKDGNSIELRQYTLDMMLTLDNEEADLDSFNIDNFSILFKEKYGMKTYFWNTNDYQFRLHIIDDGISTEDGIELIRSVVKYK
ncbi:MAG: DUF4367 domain-containing protein [Clostridia bacterium]|nr:DUF4367 domain-containing protein [Clostridia bacterium]